MKKKAWFLLLLLLVVTTASNVKCSPQVLEDPVEDLLNIWTGDPAEVYLGFVDVVSVEHGPEDNMYVFRITFSESLSDVGTIFLYLVVDTNGLGEDNSDAYPLHGGDVMYWVRITPEGITAGKSKWTGVDWRDVGTEAYATRLDSKSIGIYIPISELGEELGVQKWRLVTECSMDEISGIGDFVPDEGLAEIYVPPQPPPVTEAPVTIRVPDEVSVVTIDGINYTPENGVVEVSLDIGYHVISVPVSVPIDTDTRMDFVSWSDGVTASNRSVEVTSEGVDLEANYEVMYRVTVISRVGTTQGSGWYAQGSMVSIGVAPESLVMENKTRYVFLRWEGTWGNNVFNPAQRIQTVGPLEGPIVVVARWRVEYYVEVISKYDYPRGEGWYPAMSNAIISVERECVFTNGTKAIFVGWEGDINSTSPEVSITVDSPKTVNASWEVYYKVALTFVDDDNVPVTPSRVSIAGPEGGIPCTPKEATCVIWAKPGTYKVVEAIYMGVDVSKGTTIPVSSPIMEYIPLSIYDVTVRVKDFLGRPLAGVTVVLTLPTGKTITRRTGSDGAAIFEDVPAGHYKAETRGIAINSRKEFDVESDTEVTLGGNVTWGEIAISGAITLGGVGAAYYVLKMAPCPPRVKRSLTKILELIGNNLGSLDRCLEELDRLEEELGSKVLSLERVKIAEGKLRDLLQRTIETRDRILKSFDETMEMAKMRGDFEAVATIAKGRLRVEERFDKKIKMIESELKKIEKTRADLEGEVKTLEGRVRDLEFKIASQLEGLNNTGNKLLALLSKYTACFNCDYIYKLYTGYLDRAAYLEGLADRLKKDIERREEELKNLKETLDDLRRKREECTKKLDDIAREVRTIFHDMISDNPAEYIVICGVKVDLSKAGVQGFMKRYDVFRDNMSHLTRDYWRLRREKAVLEDEIDHTEAEIKASIKALNLARKRLRVLEALAQLLKSLADGLDKIYKRCLLGLRRCRDRLKRIIGRVFYEDGAPLPAEKSLNDLRNDVIKTLNLAQYRLDEYERVIGEINVVRQRIDNAISDAEKAKEPPCPPKYRERVAPLLEPLDDAIDDLENLEEDCDELEADVRKESKKARILKDDCTHVRDNVFPSFRGKLEKLLQALEEARCVDDCRKIEREFWREWRNLEGLVRKLKVTGYQLTHENDFKKRLSDEIVIELEDAKKVISETNKRVRKTIAALKILELLSEEEKQKLLETMKQNLSALEESISKSEETVDNLETGLEIGEKCGIKSLGKVKGLPRNVGKILGRCGKLINIAKEVIELFKQPKLSGDILYKFATVMSLVSYVIPYKKVPVIGQFLEFYIEALKIFSKALNAIELKVFERNVELLKLTGELDAALGSSEDALLRGDVSAQLENLKKVLRQASLNEYLIEKAAKEYLIMKLREVDP